MDPYKAYVDKRLGTKAPDAAQAPSSVRVSTVRVPELEASPYRSVVESSLTKRRQAAFDKGTADMEASMKKDQGAWSSVKGWAKAVPGASMDVLTEGFKNPLTTAQSVVLGAMNVGPRMANLATSIADGIGSKLFKNYQKGYRLPLPGESFASYVGGEADTDVQKAIRTGSEQFAGYELGQAGVGALGIAGKAKSIVGDVVGGQLVSDAETPRERLMQAAFDGIFGLAEIPAGAALRKVVGTEAKAIERAAAKAPSVPEGVKVTKVVESPVPPKAPSSIEVIEGSVPAEPRKPAKTAYVAKDMGLDSRGKRIMATTEVDSRTGNAIVYYDRSLDATPDKRQLVWDFEEPHILSKRLGGGQADFASALSNPEGNKQFLEGVLSGFSDRLGMSVRDLSDRMTAEIRLISKSDKPMSEQFADAFGIYRNRPDMVAEKAPLFAKFMESPLVDGRYSSVTKTADDFAEAMPDRATQFRSTDPNAPKDNVISINNKFYELEGPSKQQYLKAKAEADATIANPRVSDSTKKAVGMRLSALKRELTGDYTSTEINNLIKKERSNYIGKEVVAKVNGLEFYGKVTGKPSYGNVPVELAGGQRLNVKSSDISDPRTTQEIIAKITDRPDVKPFEGKPAVEPKVAPKKAEAKRPDGDEPPAPKTKAKEPDASGKPSKVASTGLDTKKTVKGRSSFRADKNVATQDVEVFMNRMDAENANFSSQRMSKSNEDIKDLARLSGVTPEELIQARPGSLANSETITAARQMVLDKASELVNYAKGKSPDTMTNAERKALRDKFVELVAVQKAVAGFRTEASNALRSFGIELRPGENIAIDELLANMQKMGVASEGDVAAFAQKFGESTKLTNMQKFGKGALQTWYGSILSGPKTTIRNVLSTGGNIMTDIASKAANPKTWNEIGPSLSGLIRGLSNASKDFKKEVREAFTLKATDPDTGKFTNVDAPLDEQVFTGKWGTFGRIVETSGRFLSAQDKFLSAGAEAMERAASKAYKPDISEAVSDALSKSYAQSSVYRGAPKGKVIEGITKGLTTATKEAPVLRLLVPFVQTIGNVIDRQFDYIPLFSAMRLKQSVIARQVDRIAKDFDITDKATKELIAKRLRDQQIGRMNLGLGMTAAAVAMAAKGLVSGSGPANYNERIQLQRTGWRPNSVKVGDTWVPYTFLGPLGGIFSMAGNVHDKFEYDNADDKTILDVLGKGMVGWMQSQLNSSFLSGAADLLDVLNNSKDAGKYVKDFAANLTPIPAAYTQSKDMILNLIGSATGDDTLKQQYETQGYVDKIRAKLGLTGEVFGMDRLDPRRDMFGEPMTSDLIFGVTPSKEKGEAAAVDNFLVANDQYVTIPSRKQKYVDSKGNDVKLDERQYDEYLKESGSQIYEYLRDQIERGGFEGMSPEEIKSEISSEVASIREDVRFGVMR